MHREESARAGRRYEESAEQSLSQRQQRENVVRVSIILVSFAVMDGLDRLTESDVSALETTESSLSSWDTESSQESVTDQRLRGGIEQSRLMLMMSDWMTVSKGVREREGQSTERIGDQGGNRRASNIDRQGLGTRLEDEAFGLLSDGFDRNLEVYQTSLGEGSSTYPFSDPLAVTSSVNQTRRSWEGVNRAPLAEPNAEEAKERERLASIVPELYEKLSIEGLIVLRAKTAVSNLETELIAARRTVDLASEVFAKTEIELQQVNKRLTQLEQ